MPRRPFIRKQKRKQHGTNFWDKEYTQADHLALSTEPSEDFLKFTRFCERHYPHLLAPESLAFDAGCGNGRQLRYLKEHYAMRVAGYDSSAAAIKQARDVCNDTEGAIAVRSIAEPILLPDETCTITLDMMSSHFLSKNERARLRDELARVLISGSMLLMKTFLRDDDLHTARLLRDHPGPEEYSYIHPIIGVPEYVYSEVELREFLAPHFTIVRIYRSHKHRYRGQARKRRTITVYAQKTR